LALVGIDRSFQEWIILLRATGALMPRPKPKLWQCPTCRRRFANKDQSHFCSNVTLASHFKGKPPQTRQLFRAFLAAIRTNGPVKVLPEKTRIAFQIRMSFAALTPRRAYLRGHLVLAARQPAPCFHKIETLSPRNHVHHFVLRDQAQLEALAPFITKAYHVGRQDHLAR
jgi:hypothetical protein